MSQPRFGESRCPACGFTLIELPTSDEIALASGERGAPLSVCASCCGVWFDWWAGETAQLAKGLGGLPRAAHAPMRGDGQCPRDHAPLVAQPYLDLGPVVRRCPRCMGLFAARAQVDELARFADRLPDAPLPIEDRTLLSRLWRLLQ